MFRISRIMPIGLLTLAAVIATAMAQTGAPAPATPPPTPPGPASAEKVAVVDTVNVFTNMQETVDLKKQLDDARLQEEQADKQKRAAIAQLEQQRENVKPDSKQFTDLSEQIDDANSDLESWTAKTRLVNERQQKQMMKSLYQEIQDAVNQRAQEGGYDLVITTEDEAPPSIEKMTYDQYRAMLESRIVMFHSARVDITQLVLTTLDAEYAKRKGG